MKRVRINAGKIGLVFRHGDYHRVLTEGIHWVGFRESVTLYNTALSFTSNTIDLEVFLRDEALVALWHVIDVLDHELVIVYKNKKYSQTLTAGRYVFWKGLVDYQFTRADLTKIHITEKIDTAVFAKYDLLKHIRVFEVASYEKAVMLVNDEYVQTLTGGTYRFWRNDTTIKIAKADMRQLQLEIAGQELLTKDKATVRLNFHAQYKVTDLEKALLDTKDYEKQLYVSLQLALRAYVGSYSLDELLESKEALAQSVFENSKETSEKLGVTVLSCGVRDVILTGDMKEIMNRVLIAQKTAQAHVITRREETASTRSLLNTAKLMEDNEMLYKLKEMEYVEKIADKVGEITLSGNSGMVKQLKELFTTK
ncbi:slipin family protein [Dokdonia ponticola]|uniref:Slipin family protein n=1 Tax=Dokdonia ponticola TaxID=2041041 RepID=A0ABV9HY90_9FLAO